MQGRLTARDRRRRLEVMTETLSLSDIEALAFDCLTRTAVPPDRARLVARDVATAEGIGDRGDGLTGLLRDLRLLRYGRLHADAAPRITATRPGILRLDAAHGFAAAALADATDRISTLTRTQGIAHVAVVQASAPGSMTCALTGLAAAGLATLAVPDIGPMRLMRPGDALPRPFPTVARGAPDGIGDPSPVGGPVDHRMYLTVIDTEIGLGDVFAARLWNTAPGVDPQDLVSVPGDLLAALIGA